MDEKAPITIEAVDIGQILKTLPHRYPMLLIDRVIDIRKDFSGIGIKNVSANEPQFQGHFPNRPIYPGVLMIEGMAQTAGVIGTTDTTVQTSVTTPSRFNQWYGFGAQEEIYYRVTGSTSTTAPYIATMSTSAASRRLSIRKR